MNPESVTDAISLAKETEKGIPKSLKAEVVIAPPFPFLAAAKKVIKRAELGAQDDFWEFKGARTGEVSPTMLKNSGVKYVIVGHSERRALGETDEMINKKIEATLKAGLKPILCVGEPSERGLTRTLRGFTRNYEMAKNYIRNQLEKDLKNISNLKRRTSNIIVAYEPIWAIGTGKPDKPEDSLEMIRFIKGILSSKFGVRSSIVLYGGSVNSQNARSFLQYKEIDGALVGGASLNAKEFSKIVVIVNNANAVK